MAVFSASRISAVFSVIYISFSAQVFPYGKSYLPEASSNYAEIAAAREKWARAVPRGGAYFRKRLHLLLLSFSGKEIETPYDYIPLEAGGIRGEMLMCRFRPAEWLIISGPLNAQSFDELRSKSGVGQGTWWRSGKLVSVRGRIRSFSLGTARGKHTLELFLDEISLSL